MKRPPTLIRAGKRADPVTLKTYFEQDETLNEIGGAGLSGTACGGGDHHHQRRGIWPADL